MSDCSLLDRLYYLQHYGVPTCFMDFSRNPLVAIYFAIISVKASSSYRLDKDGNPIIHPPGPYISVYELNHRKITELLNVKSIDEEFSGYSYSKYKIHNYHLALDISPIKNCLPNTMNDNLIRQDGCFVLYDNKGGKIGLDQFIQSNLNVEISEPLISEYRLGYNKIFSQCLFEDSTCSLFEYLKKNRISGQTLFNDIQGIKYDLNFYHN